MKLLISLKVKTKQWSHSGITSNIITILLSRSTCFHFSSFWKDVLCGPEQNSMWWQGECEICGRVELLVPKKLLGNTTKLQLREVVFNPKNSPSGEGTENIDSSLWNVNKSLGLVGGDDVIVREVYEMLVSSIKTVLLHINTMRMQAEDFENNKADSTE